ncbi:CidA/LrgA family protein [Nocardioides gilvus]|uniref:CidA/LrgA family protein n=1 Tax=Nocardioides gilvus TaxID=1735589 RepID=UPI000D747EB1|nr:CidA/LrgA family protein [Nocardioides gilvus]
MIRGLTVLLLCQLLGEVLVDLTGLVVPGPVVGMVLLFGWLQWRRPASGSGTVRAANGLLKHLQLFFVPAGVGVIAHAAVLRQEALPITVALVGSWLAGLLVVGWIVQLAGREHAHASDQDGVA